MSQQTQTTMKQIRLEKVVLNMGVGKSGDAIEVAKILPKVRVLFTSGYTEDHIVNSGSLERGVDFLQKPYSIQTLAKKVREVIDKNLSK